MKWLVVAALFLVMPASSFARSAVEPTTATSSSPDAAASRQAESPALPKPTNVVLPVSSGAPHMCRRYPPAAVRRNEYGATVLGFLIDTGGTLRDIAISISSGYADLDQAAIACASQWTYLPAKMNGQPIDSVWSAIATWSLSTGRLDPSDVAKIRALGQTNCANKPVAGDLALKPTVALVQVNDSAKVTSVKIVQTSGDPSLDQFVEGCVTDPNFKFRIANDGHIPHEILLPEFWHFTGESSKGSAPAE